MALHRRNHAEVTRPWRDAGTDSAFAFDRATTTWAVSTDHLPPTSAVRTTRRALPPPMSSLSSAWLLPMQSLLSQQRLAVQCHLVGVWTPVWCRWPAVPRGTLWTWPDRDKSQKLCMVRMFTGGWWPLYFGKWSVWSGRPTLQVWSPRSAH